MRPQRHRASPANHNVEGRSDADLRHLLAAPAPRGLRWSGRLMPGGAFDLGRLATGLGRMPPGLRAANAPVRPKGAMRPIEFASYPEALTAIRPALIHAAVFSGVVNLLMFTGPVFMLQVYDRVLQSGSTATLLGLLVLAAMFYAFFGVFAFFRSRVLGRAAYMLEAGLARRALRETTASGGRSDAVRDVAILRQFVARPALASLYDLPWSPLFVIVVALIHPLLGLLTLAGLGVVLVAAILNHRRSGAGQTGMMAAEDAARDLALALRREGELTRALGMTDRLEHRWAAKRRLALALTQRSGEGVEGIGAFSKAFRQFLQSAILAAGAWLAIGGAISPGMIIAVSILSGRALAPVDQIIGQWSGITRARLAHRALHEALGVAPALRRTALPRPEGRVSVDEVAVRVPAEGGRQRHLLEGVSFELAPGAGLAVIGGSGAGKSTLARVLVGALVPDAGEVRLDGARLDQWPADQVGRHVGWLPQRVEFVPGTVGENIARFDEGDVDTAVVAAARLAGVHDLILSLPQGYETPLGPSVPLSGGQAQRIALARALYGEPSLVVLDEPNAALDAAGEAALRAAISAMRDRGATVIVMTHKASVIGALDHVLILRDGRRAAFGPREEIMRPAVQGPLQTGGRQSLIRKETAR